MATMIEGDDEAIELALKTVELLEKQAQGKQSARASGDLSRQSGPSERPASPAPEKPDAVSPWRPPSFTR